MRITAEALLGIFDDFLQADSPSDILDIYAVLGDAYEQLDCARPSKCSLYYLYSYEGNLEPVEKEAHIAQFCSAPERTAFLNGLVANFECLLENLIPEDGNNFIVPISRLWYGYSCIDAKAVESREDKRVLFSDVDWKVYYELSPPGPSNYTCRLVKHGISKPKIKT